MAHFALICPPFFSHVKAFEAIGEELLARGHRATLILHAGGAKHVDPGGIAIETVGDARSGSDSIAAAERAARGYGPLGILRTVQSNARLTDALCLGGPAILRCIGADAVLADQMEPGGALIARQAGLEYLSIACALPIDFEPTLPPPFVDWSYDPTPEGVKRNRGGVQVAGVLLREQRRMIAEWSMRFGLAGVASMQDLISPRGTISQLVPGFDFPRRRTDVHRVGPFRRPRGAEPALPFEPDPGRPLVFASLGTLQGHRLGVFRAIAAAARSLDVQLALAHCGGLTDEEAHRLGADFVADFLPQRATLARAAVCVTHAGLNTALDALEAGVPSLAIPITYDQPGIAARIEHHGVGLKLSRVLLSERAIRSSLRRLLEEDGFRERAKRLGAEFAGSNGAAGAADIIERELVAGKPAEREPEPESLVAREAAE